MIRVVFLMLVAAVVNATSVYPELHECPVCGLESVKISIASYSQFGEPERDLSDSPNFRFANVEICSGDLYASWSDAWEKIDPEERAKLAVFLKEPALRLTEAERTAVTGHEQAFSESGWLEPLWARTCDGFRTVDERRQFDNVLRLHFSGRFFESDRVPEDWEKRLVSIFRDNAISALKEAAVAEWPKPHEKRVFAYLRGELTRQAGRDAEALKIFKEVIAAEKAAEPNEELEWIARWASEQSLRCGPEAKDPDKLLAEIISEMPDPWRERKAIGGKRWPRHYAAVDVLARRAADGDRAFSNTLWKLLDRKPERLLAFLETTGSKVRALRSADPRWGEWFDEIAAWIDAGKLPSSLADDPNDARVINVLRSAVGGGEDERKAWRDEVFLPAVRKAAAQGGIPDLMIPEDNCLPILPTLPDEDPAEKVASEPSLNDLSRELYDLWEQQPASVRAEIARVYTRILRKETDEREATQYPASYFLPGIAETEAGRAAIAREFEGEWNGSFWKAACAYAARLPNSAEALLGHPFTPKANAGLIVKLLLQRSDAGWKDEAIKKLNKGEWVSSEVVEYLDSLDLPETKAALEQFTDKIRKKKKGSRNGGMDGELSTLQKIEGLRVRKRMAELPIR